MALRRIVTYGTPVLRQRTKEVANVDGELQQLIDDMVDTMYAAPGVGLAANQVGSPHRLFVANPADDRDPSKLLVVINPEIAESDGDFTNEEGCLSIPDYREEVRRARRVLLRGLDRQGTPIEVEGRDLLARIFQHEMDHLNGLFFVDRLSPAKRDILTRKLKRPSSSPRPDAGAELDRDRSPRGARELHLRRREPAHASHRHRRSPPAAHLHLRSPRPAPHRDHESRYGDVYS